MTDEEFYNLLVSAPIRFINYETDIHITPQDDWFDHDSDLNCPCHPFQDPQNVLDMKARCASKYLFIHRQIKYRGPEQH